MPDLHRSHKSSNPTQTIITLIEKLCDGPQTEAQFEFEEYFQSYGALHTGHEKQTFLSPENHEVETEIEREYFYRQ